MLRQQKAIVAAVAAAGLMVASSTYAQTVPQKPAAPAVPAAKSPAQAQPPAGPPPADRPGGPGRGRGMGMGPQGMAGGGPLARLDLTQAQRDQVRALRDQQLKDTQALGEKMRAARQKMREAMRADLPDEAAVRSAAGAVAALQADRAALRARARSQFMKVLTPEQQARVKDARVRAAQRAQRAMRAQRQMMRRGQMMRRNQMMGPGPQRFGGRGAGMGPMGAPMTAPMWRQRQLRQEALRRWRGWI
jgi:protein CpxP